MLWIYRFFIGYLDVAFSGDITETILNICAKNGITVWNVRRAGGRLHCRMTVSDFKRLPRLLRGKGLRVHISGKHGIPFFVRRYRRRYGIPVGILLFFAILKLLSCFVWSVETEGNSAVSSADIIDACREIGIYEGAPIRSIRAKPAGQKLLLKVDGLNWASVNMEGCRVTVNVTESGKQSEKGDEPTNLTAAADGIITKIDVTAGNCVVKVGDTVAKGDLLVSGIIERAHGVDYVRSAGTVTAKTEREMIVRADFRRVENSKTGKKAKRRVLSLFGVKIPLYLGREGRTYESSLTQKNAVLFGQRLPIAVYTKTMDFTEEKEIILSQGELEKELEALFLRQVEVEKIGDFEVKNREIDEFEGGLSLKTVISAEENIAVQSKLLFSTGN